MEELVAFCAVAAATKEVQAMVLSFMVFNPYRKVLWGDGASLFTSIDQSQDGTVEVDCRCLDVLVRREARRLYTHSTAPQVRATRTALSLYHTKSSNSTALYHHSTSVDAGTFVFSNLGYYRFRSDAAQAQDAKDSLALVV